MVDMLELLNADVFAPVLCSIVHFV